MRPTAPCKDCPERFVREENGKVITCHSTCAKWAEHEKLKEEAYNTRSYTAEYRDYCRGRQGRIEKALHRKYRNGRK